MKFTRDLWFASFLVDKGFNVEDIKIIDERRSEFGFNIDNDQWRNFKLDFVNSHESRIKYNIEKLKDMAN